MISGSYHRRGGVPGAWPAAASGGGADVCTLRPDAAVRFACRRAAGAGGAVNEADPRRRDAGTGLAIAFDGRLDDRGGLCDALGVPHPERPDLTDSALLLRAWRRWGRECPARLLGDYAFAVWDARARTLFCARDHVGAKPFFYSLSAQRLVFATSLEAVLAAPGVGDALDETTIAAELTRGPPPATRTFFRAVRRLPPGHALVVAPDAARLERWWRPEQTPLIRAASDDAYAETFLDLYTQAVRSRLGGGLCTGVHLSGGLDSSSVAVLAARELRRQGRPPPTAFTWLPPPGPGPRNAAETAEYGPLEAVAAQEGLPVSHCAPGVEDVLACLRRDGARQMCESTLLQEVSVQRRAAEQGVRVLLSGWGGDEGISFNGRGYYAQLLLSGRLGRLWRELRERGRPLRRAVTRVILPLAFPGARRAIQVWRGAERPRRTPFINPAFARRAKLPPAGVPRYTAVRSAQLALLEYGHLSRRIEGWAESAAPCGIEYRYPLLDRRVLEFALGLPPDQFRRGRWSRWLMRHALRTVLPPAVCWNRNKRDPVRFNAVRAAVDEALPVIRRALEARGAPPTRAQYLDLPRLLARLDADRRPAAGQPEGKLGSALRFLDF